MEKIKEFPRKGGWALDEKGRVGLVFLAVFDDGTTQEEFHIVNEAGETRLIQYRMWVPSDELLATEGAVIQYRQKDGMRIEEFVPSNALSADDADLPIETYPWTALTIAPVSAIPQSRIAHLSAETLASMGYT